MDISLPVLLELALDLSKGLNAKDRFERLLNKLRSTIPCDAIVLLEKQQGVLVPLAIQGLNYDVLGRHFHIEEHPRFEAICASNTPVRFPSESNLPDPYDGLLLAVEGDLPVHSCVGLPLMADNELIGVLTLDSLSPGVFDPITNRNLSLISAMSAAALKTAILLESLEKKSAFNQQVVKELIDEALEKDGGELIGNSDEIQKLKQEIDIVAASDFTVLIEGETGVGKELVARNLHRKSRRSHAPLVYVNCAALPENLVESELFGHIKGAFTGADTNREGKFNLAHGGTIFLDEIGELPLSSQGKLLRVLQNNEIQPIGQDNIKRVDVRVVAATNRDLEKAVDNGYFRSDLYHRLSVYPIKVPPLRNRGDDVILLTGYFIEQVRRKLGVQQLKFEAQAYSALGAYSWPGNVRELEHIIMRAALKSSASSSMPVVTIPADLIYQMISYQQSGDVESTPINIAGEDEKIASMGIKALTENYQKELIFQSLERNNGNLAAAARELKVDRANLNRRIKRLGIEIKKEIIKR